MKDFRHMRALERYRMNVKDMQEKVRQPLYDFTEYAAAGQFQLTFFQLPRGQGITRHPFDTAGGVKGAADTNMSSSGAMPQPQKFLAESIEVHFYPKYEVGSAAAPASIGSITAAAAAAGEPDFSNDVYTFYKSGSLRFHVGSKTNVEMAPLGYFPPKTRLNVFADVSVNSAVGPDTAASDYACAVGRPFVLDPPVLLEPNQNFIVELNWPTLTPLSAVARVGVIMDGILIRNPQ